MKTNILLVEDNLADQEYLNEIFFSKKLHEYDYTISRSLNETISYSIEDFDLILLDLDLPDSKGTDTFFMTRESYPDTPIIILSSRDAYENRNETLSNGAHDFISKENMNKDELEKTIQSTLLRCSFYRNLTLKQKSAQLQNDYLKEKLTDQINENIHTTKKMEDLSHEIRTPLCLLRGISQLISKARNNKNDHKEVLVGLETSINNLIEITNNYLDEDDEVDFDILTNFEKIVSDNVDSFSTEINEFVGEIKLLLNNSCLEKDINTSVNSIIIESAYLKRYKSAILQILTNLINNSVKYTQNGFIRISFKSLGTDLYVEIEDTGSGLSESEVEKLFQRRTQFENAQNSSGIGMNIVNDLIGEIGAELDISSKKNEGTKINLRFRDCIHFKELVADDNEYDIVIVDNDKSMNILYKHSLEQYRVKFISDPEELQFLDIKKVKLLILDYYIKKNKTILEYIDLDTINCPILLATGESHKKLPVIGQYSNIDHLQKPFHIDELIRLVDVKIK